MRVPEIVPGFATHSHHEPLWSPTVARKTNSLLNLLAEPCRICRRTAVKTLQQMIWRPSLLNQKLRRLASKIRRTFFGDPKRVITQSINSPTERALRCFPSDARELVNVPAGTADQFALGSLYEIWNDLPGGHKWLHYFEFYERVIRRIGSKANSTIRDWGVQRRFSQFVVSGATKRLKNSWH
jgi:hypothetical protein